MNSADKLRLDYEEVESILADADCETSAAEVQAILCGMLAAGLPQQTNTWLTTLIDVVNEGRQLPVDAVHTIQQVFNWTTEEMNQHDRLTPMLLPDDSYPAIDQLEALTDWCQGFLLGFGLQTGSQPIINKEVDESLTDLAEISNLELEAEENEETQEALFTLIEHIRVATQLIHWEIVVKSQTQIINNTTTLH